MVRKGTGKKLQKVFSSLTIFSLVIQMFSGVLLAKPAYAEEITPAPEITQEPIPTYCPIEEPTPVPTQEAEPTPEPTSIPTSEPTLEPTPIPTEEVTPTVEPTIEPTQEPAATQTPALEETQPVPEVTVSVESASTEANPTEEPKGTEAPRGELAVVIVEETQAELPPVENACLVTDKPDYTPTEKVLISGSGFVAGATYILVISSQDNPPVNHEANVTANENGEFFYSYQLDGTYRPNYKVEAKDESGNVIATTTFTDTSYGVDTYESDYSTGKGDFLQGETVYAKGTKSGGSACLQIKFFDKDGNSVGSFCSTSGTSIQCSYTLGNEAEEGTWNVKLYTKSSSCGTTSGWGSSQDTENFGVHTSGSLKIVKHVDGGSASANEWTMNYASSGITPSYSGSFAGDESGITKNVHIGDYDVTESNGPANYTLSYTGNCNSNGRVTVVHGQTKTCTLTNTYSAPIPTPTSQRVCFCHNVNNNPHTICTDNQGEINGHTTHVNNGTDTMGECPTPTPQPVCGNNQVESGEQCDDGNQSNTDNCLNNCQNATCGDGYLWSGQEQCDDRNITNGDGCSSTCQLEQGTLIIRKIIVGSYPGDPAGPNYFPFYFRADDGQGNVVVKEIEADGQNDEIFNVGTYNITEEYNPNYTPSYSNCSNVVVVGGGTATCEITNTRDTGTITLDKITHPTGDSTQFTLNVNYRDVLNTQDLGLYNSLQLADADAPAVITAPTNWYSTNEVLPAGWTSDSVACIRSDGYPLEPSNFHVNLGANVTCTFTNSRPYCGDNIVQPNNGEECDDGNINDTDACNRQCQFNPITIKAYKIVCDSEADLPNWGGTDGSGINANTAQNFVDNSNGKCRYGDGWDFQWGFADKTSVAGVDKLIGTHIGLADGTPSSCASNCGNNTQTGPNYNDWKNFDTSTDAGGMAQVQISDLEGAPGIWVRENLKPDYVPFTYPPKGGTEDNVTAEIYCRDDVYKYDNYDQVGSPVYGQTYYCVAFNALNYGSITINKDSVPNDGQDFNFTRSFGGSFILDDDSNATRPNTLTFNNLVPGSYSVTEAENPNWQLTNINCTGGQTLRDGRTINITLAPGENITCTFVNRKYGTIVSYKYLDANNNGHFETGENRLDGWLVSLYDSSWNLLKSMNTGDDTTEAGNVEPGHFTFKFLIPGAYYVCETLQNGWTQTEPTSGQIKNGTYCRTVNISAGSLIYGIPFGNIQLGSILVHKFEDNNNNGSIDANEAGLSGWEMGVYDGFGCQSQVIQNGSQNTDSNGDAQFPNLIAGNYSVKETEQQGWQNTTPICQDVTVTAGQQSTVNVGNIQYGTIDLGKCNDINGDGGECDGSEPMLPGWTLFLDENGDGILNGNERSGVTDSQGMVNFANVLPRNYGLCEVEQAGWVRTKPTASNCFGVTLNPGGLIAAYFANFKLGQITACKYEDLDGDGIKDEDESGMMGIALELQVNNGERWNQDVVLGRTGDDGCYTFANLGPGTYRVRENLEQEGLEGYSPTDNFTTEGNYRLTDGITMTSNGNFGKDFFNVPPAGLILAKTNDKTSGASGGDIVTYSLTVTNDKRKLVNAIVMDFMPFGFTYVSGSGKINDVSANPIVLGNILIWSIGDLDSLEVTTIEYQAHIPSDAKGCNYTNIAFASAKKSVSGPSVGSNLANSKVPVGRILSLSVGVGGAVLGAATGEVLPAAGSNTDYLLLAIVFIILGFGIKKFSARKYEKNN